MDTTHTTAIYSKKHHHRWCSLLMMSKYICIMLVSVFTICISAFFATSYFAWKSTVIWCWWFVFNWSITIYIRRERELIIIMIIIVNIFQLQVNLPPFPFLQLFDHVSLSLSSSSSSSWSFHVRFIIFVYFRLDSIGSLMQKISKVVNQFDAYKTNIHRRRKKCQMLRVSVDLNNIHSKVYVITLL